MIDTGAAVSLFDAELGAALNLDADIRSDRHLDITGIGRKVRRLPCWNLEVSVLPDELNLRARLLIGLVPQLAKSVGNLLGRDFLETVHFGLNHGERMLYVGTRR